MLLLLLNPVNENNILILMKLMNKGIRHIRLILNLQFTFYRSRKLTLLFAVICPSFFPQTCSMF